MGRIALHEGVKGPTVDHRHGRSLKRLYLSSGDAAFRRRMDGASTSPRTRAHLAARAGRDQRHDVTTDPREPKLSTPCGLRTRLASSTGTRRNLEGIRLQLQLGPPRRPDPHHAGLIYITLRRQRCTARPLGIRKPPKDIVTRPARPLIAYVAGSVRVDEPEFGCSYSKHTVQLDPRCVV